ncbi:MAG: 3-dehydroquinate synthase [Patescibacteria group bacterium]|nr:3-dehydroquinate synthase [Patescibacteria group bacterium]
MNLRNLKKGKYCVITDENIYNHYKELIPGEFDLIVKTPGESIKTLENIGTAAEKLLNLSLNRESTLIALGGGTIGDFTGFLASIYMRGIPYIQIPTTLLAMIDSSIGGKTGVNLEGGKNMLGTFYQPQKIILDPKFLQTLPKKELLNGIAETIKHACTFDKKLFEFLEKNSEKILAKDKKTLAGLIEKSATIKKKIVEKDEKEKGPRMLLNYGHTIGHAVEKASSYRLSHGEAVAIGIHQVNLKFNFKDTQRIEKLLKLYKLPTEIPDYLGNLEKLIQNDKKSGKWVVLDKIGKAKITCL